MTTAVADPGLLERFRAAGERIQWRPVVEPPKGKGRPRRQRTVQIAHLHDEESRVESEEAPGQSMLRTDSGPVGALVILLEIDRRGLPTTLRTFEAGQREGFGSGALEAAWVTGKGPEAGGLPISDLVGLARYALA